VKGVGPVTLPRWHFHSKLPSPPPPRAQPPRPKPPTPQEGQRMLDQPQPLLFLGGMGSFTPESFAISVRVAMAGRGE
jgi:hypothetical protein